MLTEMSKLDVDNERRAKICQLECKGQRKDAGTAYEGINGDKMPLVSNTLIVVKNESDLEDLEDDLDVEEKVGMNEDK